MLDVIADGLPVFSDVEHDVVLDLDGAHRRRRTNFHVQAVRRLIVAGLRGLSLHPGRHCERSRHQTIAQPRDDSPCFPNQMRAGASAARTAPSCAIAKCARCLVIGRSFAKVLSYGGQVRLSYIQNWSCKCPFWID